MGIDNFLKIAVLILVSLLAHATSKQTPEPYVVYMGSIENQRDVSTEESQASYLRLLSSIIPREQKDRLSVIHTYSHAFKGFSAMLSREEATLLSSNAGVVSVFRDRILQLHTTRSWDFLQASSGLGYERIRGHVPNDVIIGIIDTGIWPESLSFNDKGFSEIPKRWKGVCMEGSDFKKSNCNRKLIGARYYSSQPDSFDVQLKNMKRRTGSPRDSVGHGTHTTSIAAGSIVLNASYYGLAQGDAKGGSPWSRIAIYKACSLVGCASSVVLKAIDDAINDGVDIISLSLGMSSIFQSEFLSDPIAIGAFHASQKRILVVCSGGNDGPYPFTVINAAPWILTVAASSIDRKFESRIILGNEDVVKGIGINFSNLSRFESYQLKFGGDVAEETAPISEASNCYPGSLDAKKIAGKIIICVDSDPSVTRRVKKMVAEDANAIGLILIDEMEKDVPFDSGSFPFSEIGSKAGAQILHYVNSTKNPTATILATESLQSFKPAPVVAHFSARGPGGLTEGLLKPDVMAPGVAILAASIPGVDHASVPVGKMPSDYAIQSGTSMACPHVAGAAAFLRSAHPRWTPSMIRSALMTTAIHSNNLGKPVTTSTGENANNHDMGAGEISPLRALSPGLVFETTTQDYLYFLCYYGYKDQVISSISGTNFSCPSNSRADLISNINYPSISIARLDNARSTMTVRRTVTNVGPANATYIARIDAPRGIEVKVSPDMLAFKRRWMKASYHVTFDLKGANKGYSFGSLTWSDSRHLVRSVFAVNVM